MFRRLVCVASLVAVLPAWAQDTADHPVPKKMFKRMSERLSCDADAMKATFIEEITSNKIPVSSWTIDGCSQSPFIVTYWENKGGDFQWWSDVDLRKKAPFDLSCDASAIKYTFIDMKTRGVEGCEHKFTYVLSGAGWVANVGH